MKKTILNVLLVGVLMMLFTVSASAFSARTTLPEEDKEAWKYYSYISTYPYMDSETGVRVGRKSPNSVGRK